jgi:hypothetical protein
MFIDRLLEILPKLPNEYETASGIDKVKIVNNLHGAIAFQIDNIVDYVNIKIGDGNSSSVSVNDCPNVRMPFSLTYFEYKPLEIFKWAADKSKQERWSMMATLVEEVRWADKLFHYVWNFKQLRNGDIGLFPPFTYTCDYKGNIIDWGVFNELNEERDSGIFLGLFTPLLATSFLHCKNVIINSTEPSVKLQKARERRGKLPLFTFKTLEIKSMVKILREEGHSETEGLKRALHICRGHFKDFTQGPGLGRGHGHGLYWWDSQVRGNREIGAVIKDYKVSPNVE